MRPPSWTTHAACRGADPDLFFPKRGGRVTRAKRICGGCEVRAECLAMALAGNEHGIWGGLGEEDRRRLRRRIVAA